MLGYAWARLEVLKQEQSAQFGPEISEILQRELQGYMRQGSAMEQSSFQSSLVDFVRSYEPAIAVATTLGGSALGREARAEVAAHMATKTRTVRELIPAFAEMKHSYDDLVAHTAKHAGIELDRFKAMIEQAGA